jgi:hypothetical protein
MNSDKPMSLGASIWHIAKFLIFAGLTIYFAYFLYERLVVFPEQQEREERNIQQYGCPNPKQMQGLVMCP